MIELSIGGMTCASCAARIERKLNKLDGVTATVNFATEKAKVTYPDGVDPRRARRRGGEGRLHRRPPRAAAEPEEAGRAQAPSRTRRTLGRASRLARCAPG